MLKSRLRASIARCLLLSFVWVALCARLQAAEEYLIGRGQADITGPLVGVQLWGFGRPDQIGEGLHIRQRARAFIMAESADPASRLAFVSVDLGSVDHHITLEVVERLQQRFGDAYSLDNVIISATHTHAGPGGHWHSRSDTGLDGGLYPAHFEAIVAGIVEAFESAHYGMRRGTILINTGQVPDAGVNRSRIAYLENPSEERARYTTDTNQQMVLLKFVDQTGDIAMLNWYALHPTAMNYHNLLISGDHKGYASLRVERDRGTTYRADEEFVAAFAQADPGDVTPNTNLDNTGPGDTDVETTRIMGDRQAEVAEQLFSTASEQLTGTIATRRIYVDLRDYAVSDAYTGAGEQTTCPSAYGYSFAGGSTEDGGAHFLFREGMTQQSVIMDWLIRFVTGAPRWTQAVKDCQAPKPILFETGTGDQPLQSQIRSITLARVGQLVILAVPAEVTTMSGRRLRASVLDQLGDWAKHIVIAGYSNGFAGYITTPQEYMLQQYEAAHTLHGKWSLPAYQQVAAQLARSLNSGTQMPSGPTYDDWRGRTVGMPLPMGEGGSLPQSMSYGEVLQQPAAEASRGDSIAATFLSVHPNRRFVTAFNYLRVERLEGQSWQAVADDSDWTTRIRWLPDDDRLSAKVSWEVTDVAEPGSYRLVHVGLAPDGVVFRGNSRPFTLR